MIIKRIHSQDAHYKFSPKKSGETSLNLSNDIFQLIAPELTKGEEKPVSFTLFRSDYLKALSVIINHAPLYVTSSTTATEVTSDPSVFIKDFQSICTFFGPNERNTYTVNLLYRSDGRIYLNTLEDKNSKFNLRHFLVEETSSLEFEKIGDDITVRLRFDSITQNKKESTPQLIVSNKKLTSFVLSSSRHFNKIDKLDSIVPFTSPTSHIKVSKNNLFSLTGMFLESTIDDVKERNSDHIRWFEDVFKLGERNVFLSTQWNSQGDYQLTLDDLIKMIQTCYGEEYFYKTGPNGEHQLYYNDTNHQQTAMGIEKILPYLTALRTKPFMLLAGISGTGKSRIVRKLAQATTTQNYADDNDRWNDNRPENFELIQVKPNWHNSMDVVGFYSNISKKYQFTPFVEFIVKAWQDKETPYFLCLDEMNLAPVEEYFAEFLSAIESRSTDSEGNYITDPIIKPFKDFGKNDLGEDIGKNMLKHLFGEADPIDKNPLAVQFYEKGLTLPKNLMVMGTVNMDETTFSFSRKVLDRAMSVEMNEVNYDKFLSGETEAFPLLTDYNTLLVNRPQKASEVKDDIDTTKVVEYLKDVNALLEDTPFKLGYRAANEAMLYVAANKELAGEKFSLATALDEFTLMKILSRIEGDDQRLGIDDSDPRIAAAQITADGDGQRLNLLTCLRAIVRKRIGNDTQTEKKIASMCRTLEREHFVSYWG